MRSLQLRLGSVRFYLSVTPVWRILDYHCYHFLCVLEEETVIEESGMFGGRKTILMNKL